MGFGDTRVGWLCLALSFTLGAGLLSHAGGDSGAYFTDTKSGCATGTYARLDPVPTSPFRIELGKSKGLHWGPGNDCPACGSPIARLVADGSILLDFGEAPAGHGNTRPDVLRLVSRVDSGRSVILSVSGPMQPFVTEARLGGGIPDLLAGGTTRSISMKIRVPDDAVPGTYAGILTIHVQGWDEDARIPMTIVVCDKNPPEQVALSDQRLSIDATQAILPGEPGVAETPTVPALPADPAQPPVVTDGPDVLPDAETTLTPVTTLTVEVPGE